MAFSSSLELSKYVTMFLYNKEILICFGKRKKVPLRNHMKLGRQVARGMKIIVITNEKYSSRSNKYRMILMLV